MESTSINDLSSQVLESARKTGFALMKANYVERDAPELPGGKIQGLAPEANAIASALRDSIWARFDSLRFHHQLILNVAERRRQQLKSASDDDQRFNAAWSAIWHAQYLFDDLVFNAASLFDYLGNTVWFGFHGQNHIKKKWKKAYQAAKGEGIEPELPKGPSVFGSQTANVILDANRNLVDDLYQYRSELIHNRMDSPEVFKMEFWQESVRPDAALTLPPKYARHLGSIIPSADNDERIDMAAGAEVLIERTGETTLKLLETLREDLDWSEGEPLTMLSGW